MHAHLRLRVVERPAGRQASEDGEIARVAPGGVFGSNASGAQSDAPSGNAKRGGATPITW